MKVIINFSRHKTDLDRLVQRINTAAKQLNVTYKINSKNKPNYEVDPNAGLIINKSDKKKSIRYQNYTKVVGIIRDINNGDEKLIKSTMEDLKSQYKSLISKLTEI